jgi:hypothetical protein
MINKNFTPSIGKAFSDGINLFSKAGGPMIGFWFLSLLMFFAGIFFFAMIAAGTIAGLAAGLTGGMDSFAKMGAGFIALMVIVVLLYLAFYVIFYVFWAGYSVYMGEVYINGRADFSKFFGGFKFFSKLLGFFGLILLFHTLMSGINLLSFSKVGFEDLISLSKNDPFFMYKNASGVFQLIITLVSLGVFVMCQFVIENIVINKMRVFDAITWSVKAVTSHIGFFIGLSLILLLMNIAGALIFTLGLIFTVPFTLCISHVLFQKLLRQENNLMELEIDAFGGAKESFQESM